MKRTTNHAIAVFTAVVLFLAALLTVIAVPVMAYGSNNTDVLYDPSNTDIRLSIKFKICDAPEDVDSSSYYAVSNSGEELLNSCSFSDPSDNADVYATAKKHLAKFFKKEYGIDISSKLEEIETYEFESIASLYGFSHEGKIYVNTLLTRSFNDDDLTITWVHEAIHCIGFNNTEENTTYLQLYEAATAALTEQFSIWDDLNPNTEDGYSTICNYCRQLFIVNPDLVTNQINGTEVIEDAINNELADATYPYLDTDSFTIAEYYSGLFSCVLNYGDYTEPHFLLQEITTAYCRRFNPDKHTIKELQSLYVLKDFEDYTLVEKDGTYYIELQES